jgi:hypothetical protein
MLEAIDRMQANKPPEMTEEEVREFRDRSIPPLCENGCVWIERARDAAYRYLEVFAKWRYDQRHAS